ncbi:uncharacterized protein LOC110900007 [Helianthus annuus]|uniref:uncharacterized protein LOC110900007 n=1 Tax=Helianthus annuus TaxID=4232 RepID=UPI000B908FE0|nr:uncharacterized protein LOC110900007 [Helianthus annuus]
MAGSDKINSHPMENNDNARINLTGAELKTLVDDAVKKALERQYEEYSGTRSRTLSIPHSKPPSKKDEPKKEDDERHPSNNYSDPSQQIILNQGPHDKGCSYKGMAAKASKNGKRKREDENSRRSDRKSSGLKRGSQQSVEKTKCETCRKYHLGKCRFESQPLPCGICKSQEHKTLDCEKLKDATCYGCNERGHVKTNCPKNQKKPEEAKRTNA